MLRNYLVIAWRNLRKNKVFSLINLLGLTIGITVCMLIFLYVGNEFSVDNFHANGNNIYRVMRGIDRNGSRIWVPFVSPPYAPALENDFRGMVKTAMRVMPENDLFVYDNKSFNENRVYYTDAGFFNFFSFPLLKGDPATVLKDPNSVVLTETTAKKYFGSEDPIGKVIEMDRHQLLKVTGIAKDAPSNSHLAFDVIVPIAGYADRKWFENWPGNGMYTYVLLHQPSDKNKLMGMFPQFMQKYLGERMKKTHSTLTLSLTPLKDIYFETAAFSSGSSRHGDKKVVYIFLSIAALILLIACINFMNLSTVRAVERSREVGLRKVLGALRRQLAWQFMGESFLLVTISTALAIGLAVLLLPVYNQLLGYSLTISWHTRPMYLFLGGVIVVAGLLAGGYPALVLSGFSPIESLRGKLRLGNGGALFRQVLVVMQFGISVFLIIGTIVIMRQMRYVKSRELGFDKEQTLVVKLDNLSISKKKHAFKSELQSGAGVESVSIMSGEPGGYHDSHGFLAEDNPEDKPIKLRTAFADMEFVKTLGLKIIAGRDFSATYATDTARAVLINRTAAGMLGFTPAQAIGKWIRDTSADTANRRIVGVVEDYNFLSLKQPMDGLVISPNNDPRVVLVKLHPGNVSDRLLTVKKVYSKLAPVYPFEYNFLDQKFDQLYKADVRQQTIISVFSGLAIFIACLGLFGLASFTATKRTREIGVRKVLGAEVSGIVLLLSKEMLRPVLMATFMAIPAAYYVMSNWLHNFAYRTSLDWWVFALAGTLAALIAFITVSFQTIKAALVNPIKSLRTE